MRLNPPILLWFALLAVAIGCAGSSGGDDAAEEACEAFCENQEDCDGAFEFDECVRICSDSLDEAVDESDACEEASLALIDCLEDVSCDVLEQIDQDLDPDECGDELEAVADECGNGELGFIPSVPDGVPGGPPAP